MKVTQTAHEANFKKCKALVKELCPKININLLKLPAPTAFDLAMECVTILLAEDSYS